MYCAIIGDIVKSRKIIDRNALQMTLNQTLTDINNQYREDIASNFTITLGDEFQGVLKDSFSLFRILDDLELASYPTKFRFGIGIGDITTVIDQNMSIGADGPAYYNAREMIDELKKEETRKRGLIINRMIKTSQSENQDDEMMNTILSLMTVIKRKWSKRERQIILDYMSHKDGQEGSANRLGIAQSSVQRGLDRAGYYTYLKARDFLTSETLKIWEEQSC